MLLSFRDPADLAWLEYPPLERAIVSYRALAAHHYRRCGGGGGGGDGGAIGGGLLGGVSLEQFTWALAIVGSRCLGASLLLMALMAGGSSGSGIVDGNSRGASGKPPTAAPTALPAPAPAPAATSSAAPTPLLLMTLYQMAGLSLVGTTPTATDGDEEDSRGAGAVATTAATAAAAAAANVAPVTVVAAEQSGDEGPRPPDGTGHRDGGASVYRGSAASGQLRMLVPLLDLINHAGARHAGLDAFAGNGNSSRSSSRGCGARRLVSEANVRWELRPPSCDRETASCADREPGSGGGGGGGDGGGGNGSGDDGGDTGGGGGGGDDVDGGGWRIALVASSDLAAGRELLLCYDATATNDAFALHYGFVPRSNPYDDVQLYDSLEEALAWHRAEVLAAAATTATMGEVASASPSPASAPAASPDALAALYSGAAAAAAAAACGGGDDAADLSAPIKLGPGGRLCPRLSAAFRHLAAATGRPLPATPPPGHHSTAAAAAAAAAAARPKGPAEALGPRLRHRPGAQHGHPRGSHPAAADAAADADRLVSAAVVRRCVQLLACRAPLLADLAALRRDDEEQQQQQQQQRRRQRPRPQPAELQPEPARSEQQPPRPPLAQRQSVGARALARHGQCGSPDGDGGGGSGGVGEVETAAAAAVAVTWQGLLRHYTEALSSQAPDLRALAGLGPAPQPALRGGGGGGGGGGGPMGRSGPTGRPMGHSTPAPTVGADDGARDDGAGDDDGGGDDGGGAAGAGAGTGVLTLTLTSQQRLALEYRVHKKMLLWDYVLEHGPQRLGVSCLLVA